MSGVFIQKALASDAAAVAAITYQTIQSVYPHYYPAGVVQFFLEHHDMMYIQNDIADGSVFLLSADDGKQVGTVTLCKNEICRLFVLPEYQGNGYGGMLIDFAEERIRRQYERAELHASLAAKGLYLKRGYYDRDFHQKETYNGDFICIDIMEKVL